MQQNWNIWHKFQVISNCEAGNSKHIEDECIMHATIYSYIIYLAV